MKAPMIRDLYDLAAYVGAYACDPEYPLEAVEAAIRRRLSKDTACGIGFAYHPPALRVVGYRPTTYILRWAHSVLGPRVVSWRVRGGKRRAPRDLPAHVRAYLLLDLLEYPTLRPDGGGLDDAAGVARAYPYDPWTVSAQGEKASILRRTERRGSLYMTLRLDAPVQRMDRGSVTVAGYCEGTDSDCPDHVLDFPFTGDAFDRAVERADKDGLALWDETHGCEACAAHYGVPVEDGFPVEPVPVWEACPSCGGAGVSL